METAITSDVGTPDAVVMDDLTDWTYDLDLSLEPAPQRVAGPAPRPRAQRRWGLALLVTVALLGVMALGTAALVVVAAGIIVGALYALPMAQFPEAPGLDDAVIEMVTPVIIDAPTPAVEAPTRAPARQPAATPARKPAAPAADPGSSDATMIVMPDPAFRSTPAEEAIERLKKKVENGEASTVVGR